MLGKNEIARMCWSRKHVFGAVLLCRGQTPVFHSLLTFESTNRSSIQFLPFKLRSVECSASLWFLQNFQSLGLKSWCSDSTSIHILNVYKSPTSLETLIPLQEPFGQRHRLVVMQCGESLERARYRTVRIKSRGATTASQPRSKNSRTLDAAPTDPTGPSLLL